MPKQFEDSAAGRADVQDIVSKEVRPLLDKLEELVDKLDRYHAHDIQFQQKLLLLLSRMVAKQEISMDAFDQLDLFLRKEFFWEKDQK